MQVHRIPLPTPFPVGPVNAYLIEGDPLTLVDTGPKTPEAQDALASGISASGHSVEEIRRIVLTHGHSDHFGNAMWVQERNGAEILAHAADGPKYAGERWVFDHLRHFLGQAGAPPAFLERFTQRLHELRTLFDPVTTFQPVGDADAIEVGGDRLRILHCPGHSLGHICLFHQEGTLIAGDTLLDGISPNPMFEFAEDGKRIPTLPLYLQSLRRILLLNCEAAHPGHGERIAGPSGRIRELIAQHEQKKEEIFTHVDRNGKTLVAIAQELYPAPDELGVMLAFSEVVGHLDLLVEEKRVSATRRGSRLIFRARSPR